MDAPVSFNRYEAQSTPMHYPRYDHRDDRGACARPDGPRWIVDHAEERKVALARYETARRSPGHDDSTGVLVDGPRKGDTPIMLVMSVLSLKEAWERPRSSSSSPAPPWSGGLRALVVDLDPQANATTALDPKDVTFTTNDVLADARAGVLREAVTMSGWGEEVQVIAGRAGPRASQPTRGQGQRAAVTQGHERHPGCLRHRPGGYPPSLGELTKNALAASQRALVVAEPSLFALQGAQQALDAVDVVRRGFNLRLRTIGIVANRVRRTTEHRFRLNELTNAYGDLVFDPAMFDRSAVM